MHHGSREQPSDGHQAGDPHQHQDAGDAGTFEQESDELIGAVLGGGGQEHATDHEQIERTQTFLEHVRSADSGRHSLRLREALPDKHDPVDRGWQQHRADLHLPSEVEFFEEVDHQPADHQAAGKPSVEQIQLGGLVIGIERGHQWIARRLHASVGQPDQECGDEQRPETRCVDGQHDARDVTDPGDGQQPSHADDVAERAADHHGQRKSPERRSHHPAELFGAEVKLPSQLAHDSATDGEGHRRSDQRDATCIEQTPCVNRLRHAELWPHNLQSAI